MIAREETERREALGSLSKGKTKNLDLQNHKTAWNCLQALAQPHRNNLKRMGYGEHTSPHNFWTVKFDKANGSEGKIPVTYDEW